MLLKCLSIIVISTTLVGCDAKPRVQKPNLKWLNESYVCTPFTDYPRADERAIALYDQALALSNGEPPIDQVLITQLYEQAAELGYWAGMHNTAIRYYQGNGVAENNERALYWLQEMEKLNIPEGYYGMSLAYRRGIGVERDKEIARGYVYKAAELGDADALVSVAKSLYPIQDMEKVYIALECARDQGHKDAAWELARNYETHDHLDKAYDAYRIGAKMGSGGCLRALESAYDHSHGQPTFDLNRDVKRAACFKNLNNKVRDRSDLSFPDLDELCPANVAQPSHRH